MHLPRLLTSRKYLPCSENVFHWKCFFVSPVSRHFLLITSWMLFFCVRHGNVYHYMDVRHIQKLAMISNSKGSESLLQLCKFLHPTCALIVAYLWCRCFVKGKKLVRQRDQLHYTEQSTWKAGATRPYTWRPSYLWMTYLARHRFYPKESKGSDDMVEIWIPGRMSVFSGLSILGQSECVQVASRIPGKSSTRFLSSGLQAWVGPNPKDERAGYPKNISWGISTEGRRGHRSRAQLCSRLCPAAVDNRHCLWLFVENIDVQEIFVLNKMVSGMAGNNVNWLTLCNME